MQFKVHRKIERPGFFFFFKYSISVSILYISYRQKQKFFGILYNLSVYRIPETRNLRTAVLCVCMLSRSVVSNSW